MKRGNFPAAPAPCIWSCFPRSIETVRNEALEAHVEYLLKLRGAIAQAIEPARQEKLIGNALEADVTLQIARAGPAGAAAGGGGGTGGVLHPELACSLEAGPATAATLTRTKYLKCERCWRYREHVGKSEAHPDLCARCEEVVAALPVA